MRTVGVMSVFLECQWLIRYLSRWPRALPSDALRSIDFHLSDQIAQRFFSLQGRRSRVRIRSRQQIPPTSAPPRFGMSPEFWTNLPARYDLDLADRTVRRKIEREVEPRSAA